MRKRWIRLPSLLYSATRSGWVGAVLSATMRTSWVLVVSLKLMTQVFTLPGDYKEGGMGAECMVAGVGE